MRATPSLRTKLLVVVLLTTLVALIVALGTMIAYDVHQLHRSWLADMQTQAELLGRTTAPALAFDDTKVARENLELLRFRPAIRAAAIYDAGGKVVATYTARSQPHAFPDAPGADATTTEGPTLTVFKRIVENAEILGTVYLVADHGLYDRILDYVGIALVVAMAAMLVAFLMSAWLQALVTRPILAIADLARHLVIDRDYSRRVKKTSADEVGTLAESFNDMLAQLERRARETETAKQKLELEVAEHRRSEQEIVRLNAELEDRVRERTAQLEASNRELAVARSDAERANHAKSEFLSSMSHELRTPLNAILGFGQILASDSLTTSAEQKKEFVNQILKAGRHLLALINEILDLAKIESGAVSLSLEPVSITELMHECRELTEPLSAQRGIGMIFPPAGVLCVVADRTRLKQVVLNLLSNAIKYNRDGGSAVITCEPTDSQRVRISVRDTGIGLRPEQLDALFQPFNRLGQESGAVEGTGIGLVVTKKMVELMGGTIGVASNAGLGAEFWVELQAAAPLARPMPARGDRAAPSRPAAGAKHAEEVSTVLYVEDNPANLKLVEQIIIGFHPNLRLLSTPDAQLGVALARAHQPRVILMDINLTGLNGSDALKILQGNPRTAHIPVIAITANAMPRDIAKGLADGFFRYITKPIDLDEFAEALDSALGVAMSRIHAS